MMLHCLMMVTLGDGYKIGGHPSLPSLASQPCHVPPISGNHRHYVMILTASSITQAIVRIEEATKDNDNQYVRQIWKMELE
jgi:hypothetical protein